MFAKIVCRLKNLKAVTNARRNLPSLASPLWCRKSCATSSEEKKPDSVGGYRVIYRFSYIVPVRYLSRLKIYQTIATLALVPTNLLLYTHDLVPSAACISSLALSAFATSMLFVVSSMSQRVVGLVSISDDQSIVRFSHLSFYGKRRDIYLPLDDVIPLGDLGENVDNIYSEVRCYSDPKLRLYLSIKYGNIEDRNTFALVFGNDL